MAYTHDKYGKPIPPQVLEILNKPVPLKKQRKKRTASMAVSTPSGFTNVDADQVPTIHDVPDLYSTKSSRKIVCKRVLCSTAETPLEPSTGDNGSEDKESDISSETSSDTQSELSENAKDCRTTETSISPLSWLRSMFYSAAPFSFSTSRSTSSLTQFKQEEKASTLVQNDFPERSGCKVQLETFSISEKPDATPPPRFRAPRANSKFYRVLSLENAMCLKGKLEEPSVCMFIHPRNEPTEPHCVLGIQQKLRRSSRRWRELTEQDFQEAECNYNH